MGNTSVESHKDKVERQLDKAIEQALRLVGGLAERKAKETISDMKAVDTGFLRNSITFALDGEPANIASYQDDPKEQTGTYDDIAPKEENGQRSVYIGTNVYYAPYVEIGTHKMDARPFLSQSIQTGKEEFDKLFNDAFHHYMD